MGIFKTYTGNAMLNNALMTIEALAGLNNVSEITSSITQKFYTELDLSQLNQRMVSYYMLFFNNPLLNKPKIGVQIYDLILKRLMESSELDGVLTCEISGLKFNTTFSEHYKVVLDEIIQEVQKSGKDKKAIKKEVDLLKKTDFSINRSWYPLIGGLGSDAQALPQAKFSVVIHPFCIAVLQFITLSSVIYNGGILLIDSSNFSLTREMVRSNTKVVLERIQLKSVGVKIENYKDYTKGSHLLKALGLLAQKEDFEESYSDLNLWSFSNMGLGAKCAIDRVPNSLIKKLQSLYKNAKIGNELKGILSNKNVASNFIESLEGNRDWYRLYPNSFGTGKKKEIYEGVSPDFLEAYYRVIGKSDYIPIAKHIAGLIEKYKSKVFEKMLAKTDAWNDSEYRIELFKVLVKATENKDWTLEHQISILDNLDALPVKNSYYQLHKLVHYFTQNKISGTALPAVNVSESNVFNACKWVIYLIQNDSKVNSIKSKLTNPNEYTKVGFNRIILDALDETEIELEDVLEIFYDEDFNYRKFGLNELLRIFFLQQQQEDFEFSIWNGLLKEDDLIRQWKGRVQSFVDDYQAYFYNKHKNIETGELPFGKFIRIVNSIEKEHDDYYTLLSEMVFNTNQFIKERGQFKDDKWSVEDLMTNPLGNYTQNFCVTVAKFLLKKTAVQPLKEKSLIIEN